MVPVQLELENFLSYKDRQIVDFRELELAVLAGENGHGKSALLDAITWALFGEARKPSGSRKPDDNLLNRAARDEAGATKMAVRFVFSSEGTEYTIVRTFRETASGKTTSSDLEFRSPEKDFTAGSQRETQEIIEEVVGTNYSTFINTSFLLQGRSDEFTQKSPAERKEILTDILQLGRFAEYRSEVGRRKRQAQKRIDQIDGQTTSLEEKLEGREGREKQLEVAEGKRDDLREEIEDLDDTLAGLEEEFERKENILDEEEDLREELERLKTKRESKSQRAEKLEEKLAGYEETLEEAEDIEAAADRLDQIGKEIEEIESTRDRAQTLKNQLQSKVSMLDSKRESFGTQKEKIEGRIDSAEQDLKYELDGEELSNPEAWFHNALEAEKERDQKKEEIQEELSLSREHRSELGAKAESLRERAVELGKKSDEIDRQIQSIQEETCPTCGQVIPEEEIEEHTAPLLEKKDEVDTELGRKVQKLNDLETKKKEADAHIEKMEAELDELDTGLDTSALQENLNQIRNAKAQREDAAEELAEIMEAFDTFERETTQEIEAIKDTLATEISFDEDRLEELKEERSEIKELADRRHELKTARDEAGDLSEMINNLWEDVSELEEEITGTETELDQLDGVTSEETSDLYDDITELEETIDLKEEQLSQTQTKVGRLEEQVSTDEENAEELASLREEKKELKSKRQVYDTLFDAFGKHGIPSLIIEGVLPNIEERANHILDRLSDQAMEVRLETLKEKSDGGQKDTLDIVITDDTGVQRPYETFSGGERFRINFALRVALSQTLAQRSGAPLRTLVIDEGFGTQDEAAIGRVKDAIGEVASDFEKVLVITHLRELKNAFPQKVEVTKEPGTGSHVSITT